MKKPKFILLITGLVLPLLLGAQYTDFDLSKYKLPDIRLNRLDATFNFRNYVNNYLSQEKWDSTDSKHNELAGSLNLGYYYFRNTEKYQGNLRISTYLSQRINNYSSEDNDTKNNDTDHSIEVSSTNRFYNRKLFFIEVAPVFYFISYTDRYHYENSTTAKNNISGSITQLSAPVSVGYGRIEPVEDLRLALYILEELQKAGRIASVPAENVVIDMAREISRIKRKRFFDTRIRKIEELHVIDSFLVANDIISSNDITYFALLNDNWDYASGPARETGFALTAGIDNNIQISRRSEKYTIDNTTIIDSKDYSNIYEVGGYINIKYAKPLNLYWQTGAGINTFYGMEFTRNPQDKENAIDNFETNIFRTSINGLLQYLPNSRTSLGLDLTGSYQHSYDVRTLTDLDPDGFKMRNNLLSVSSSFDMYYYVSPRLRVRLITSLSGSNSVMRVRYESALPEEKNLTRSYYHNLSMTLTYSLF